MKIESITADKIIHRHSKYQLNTIEIDGPGLAFRDIEPFDAIQMATSARAMANRKKCKVSFERIKDGVAVFFRSK